MFFFLVTPEKILIECRSSRRLSGGCRIRLHPTYGTQPEWPHGKFSLRFRKNILAPNQGCGNASHARTSGRVFMRNPRGAPWDESMCHKRRKSLSVRKIRPRTIGQSDMLPRRIPFLLFGRILPFERIPSPVPHIPLRACSGFLRESEGHRPKL
ncbi:MAG: hypothetical protein QG650_774 [Patescibacteria group bacterium]|nr:hypothetical protein [Patescibacteria group bacterium]